jgi:hypothetical protein
MALLESGGASPFPLLLIPLPLLFADPAKKKGWCSLQQIPALIITPVWPFTRLNKKVLIQNVGAGW